MIDELNESELLNIEGGNPIVATVTVIAALINIGIGIYEFGYAMGQQDGYRIKFGPKYNSGGGNF